jgi:hypothetical protein
MGHFPASLCLQIPLHPILRVPVFLGVGVWPQPWPRSAGAPTLCIQSTFSLEGDRREDIKGHPLRRPDLFRIGIGLTSEQRKNPQVART